MTKQYKTLAEQQQLMRAALVILRTREQDRITRGMRASLTFAIADHEGAGNQCGDCTSVETARKIVAGEL